MTDLEKALIIRIQEIDQEAEDGKKYFRWLQEETEKSKKLEERIEELEAQILELSQAKITVNYETMTDSAAKGVM